MRLLVLTPERVVFDRDVEGVRIPGSQGSFGVLGHHAPLLAAVEPGELVVTEKGGQRNAFFVADGFVEVGKDVVRLVVDSGEPVTEIDLKRAQEAEKRARERLSTRVSEVDLPRAEAALRRALQRGKVARKYRAN